MQDHGNKPLGYYKWRKRKGKLNRYEKDGIELTRLLRSAHKKHLSYGYHRLAYEVFEQIGWIFSHNLAHKRCKAAGISSKARKRSYKRPCEESLLLLNRARDRWNASAPLQIVVSDMTILKVGRTHWEWMLLLDTFNNEILAHSVSLQAGSNRPYYHWLDALKSLMEKREGQNSEVIFHTDQGAVYSSRAFSNAHKHCNILRSMSRGGRPTDNPIIEALNGWIKEELYLDFDLANAKDVPALLYSHVFFFNNKRRSASLDYKSPVQFRTERGLP